MLIILWMARQFRPTFALKVRRCLGAAIASTALAATVFSVGDWTSPRHPDVTQRSLAWVAYLLFGAALFAEFWAYRALSGGLTRLDEFSLAFVEVDDQRQETTALLHTLISTTPGVIFAKDRDGRMLLANAAALALIGKPWEVVRGRTDREFLGDTAQGDAIMATDRQVMETGVAVELEEVVGEEVWLSTKTPLRNAAGAVTGLVGVSVNITDRTRTEERLRLMVNELNHRVKNTLATVQSIAHHTLRGADPTVCRRLEQRLIALSSAHDVLTRESWEGAQLMDIVAHVLAPHGSLPDGPVCAAGPTLKVLPRAALALAMGLHELATNALKYGALSTVDGRVEIKWDVIPADLPVFRLVWTERNGPAVVAPSVRGFGTVLLQHSVAQDLRGAVELAFAASGLTCEIRAPLAQIVVSPDPAAFPRVGRVTRDG